MTLGIKKEDNVQVIAGRDAGKTGRVLKVFPAEGRVLVEGVNLVKKHARRTRDNPKGGIMEMESPIQISNLMVHCGKCGRGVRTGKKILDTGEKIRICRKCGEVLK